MILLWDVISEQSICNLLIPPTYSKSKIQFMACKNKNENTKQIYF
jgi:hypothetical protein